MTAQPRVDIAHRVQAVGHVRGVGGVLVAPALQTVDGDPLSAPVEEEFDRALADAGMDLAPDMALGRGVVVVGDADVAARPDLAFDRRRAADACGSAGRSAAGCGAGMIAVAMPDAGPLISLARIGRLDLLDRGLRNFVARLILPS